MKQWIVQIFYGGVLGFGLSLSSVHGVQAEPAPGRQETIVMAGLRSTAAMPAMGYDRLGTILHRYYQEGLGGSEIWEKVISLRVTGHLTLESGQFAFDMYRKKPHYIKFSLNGNQHRIQQGYDGHSAWQALGQNANGVKKMGTAQARHFIHRAHFGTYLLDPYASGKQIEYLNTVPMNETICHQIRVRLDTDYQVDYFLDVYTYLAIKVVYTDLRSGAVNSVMYSDYMRKIGIPIAQKVVNHEDGTWVSTLHIDAIKVNAGMMAWMFKIPDGL